VKDECRVDLVPISAAPITMCGIVLTLALGVLNLGEKRVVRLKRMEIG